MLSSLLTCLQIVQINFENNLGGGESFKCLFWKKTYSIWQFHCGFKIHCHFQNHPVANEASGNFLNELNALLHNYTWVIKITRQKDLVCAKAMKSFV